MFEAINTNFAQTALAIAATIVVGIAITSAPAAAKGSRQLQTQDYHFNQAMHGYEGHANGGYFCSYVRIPKRICKWRGGRSICKVRGWTLRQECR